jgi:3-methyladenine DNA glycosylase/8-oxoguanine DNA glycosylase
MVDEPKSTAQDPGPRASTRAPVADPKARAFLRKADPVLARLIDARPDFRPRAAYGLDHPPTDEEMARLSDRWRPYRSLAVSYLFASEYDV